MLSHLVLTWLSAVQGTLKRKEQTEGNEKEVSITYKDLPPQLTPGNDILVDDGDTLSLGNTVIRFVHTPGHTKGTISLFYDDTDGERTCRVGMFGGAGANALVPGEFYYDGCREDYRKSVHRLRKEKVDVFIGNHVWNNQTDERAETLLTTGENRFIDGEIWYTFLDYCEKRLDNIIAEEQKNNQ